MTLEGNGKQGERGPQAPGDFYTVGYRKPPAEHRFKKGRSGNPRGRPRKAESVKIDGPPGSGTQLANQYLLQEAYRPVLVREGEQTIELPAIQAVFRAMGVAAMKGNHSAQRMMTELVQSVEAEHNRLRLECAEETIKYKCEWERQIDQAREKGEPEPQPIPHPDDIMIDFRNGTVRICGPKTKDEKADLNRLFEVLDDIQETVSISAAAYRESPSAEKAQALDTWMFEQKRFDRINDNLPKRYRKKLIDRCWEPGASHAGQQRKIKGPGYD
jgi:hypothetical protein